MDSTRSTCPICLYEIVHDGSAALFTAECSHVYHRQCIRRNIRHQQTSGVPVNCPICRREWSQFPTDNFSISSPFPSYQYPPLPQSPVRPPVSTGIYDDDERLAQNAVTDAQTPSAVTLQLKAIPEVSAIPRSETREEFTVLVHLKAHKAPAAAQISSVVNADADEDRLSRLMNEIRLEDSSQHTTESSSQNSGSSHSRAPVDLVAVLDTSGSMQGFKIELLKKAIRFVMRNLGSQDRLSIVAFSGRARRLFPLSRMVGEALQQAFEAVDLLRGEGMTDIGSGLRMGIKVLEDRRQCNPVSSIMLLSDGLDNHARASRATASYNYLLPESMSRASAEGSVVSPIHTFGFGSDHDPAALSFVAEASRGTYSFVETEDAIKEAFAQCVGGLLSVVVQDLNVNIVCPDSEVKMASIEAGTNRFNVEDGGRVAKVNIGELYEEEERDVLVNIQLPAIGDGASEETKVLDVSCTYTDPISGETIETPGDGLSIRRPESVSSEERVVNVNVERQRNRVRVAKTIAEAKAMADRGDLAGGREMIEQAIAALCASDSVLAGDKYMKKLEDVLREIQSRMETLQLYEMRGRAAAMASVGSMMGQRALMRYATPRTDWLSSPNYDDCRTPFMTEMVERCRKDREDS